MWEVSEKIIKNKKKEAINGHKIISKPQQRFRSEKQNAFTEAAKNIALSQSIQ